MTSSMKWFFGGVVCVVLLDSLSRHGVIGNSNDFGAMVFICCTVAAVFSYFSRLDREDREWTRSQFKDPK